MLRGLSRFVGSTFLQQRWRSSSSSSAKSRPASASAPKVRSLLRKPDVAFVLVCSPEQLSIEEALYFHGPVAPRRDAARWSGRQSRSPAGPELPASFAEEVRHQPALRGLCRKTCVASSMISSAPTMNSRPWRWPTKPRSATRSARWEGRA